ncbi:MAG: Hsp70 family protein, partial [Candidatus Brocadiales bacterium]|nr:Hsp70 family protein [Candidatus Brocadiales bacterium]
ENINSAVITVPARFEQHQIDATQKAAELAGFQYCELLQEPIAASFAYGVDAERINGKWIVFDFGGGTFDVALMSADEGIMKVIDTSGDNFLGGKNIDLAIVDSILIPHLKETYSLTKILGEDQHKNMLRNALKREAEEIKINMSSKSEFTSSSLEPLGKDDNEADIEIDVLVTLPTYNTAVSHIFKRAISITQKLLDVNNLEGKDLETILMVGGPTLSDSFRTMVREQICERIDTSIDPMTVVARGAALFASTKDIPSELRVIDRSKTQVKLKYPSTTVETEINIGVVVELNDSETKNDKSISVEFLRSDGGWSSGKVTLDGLADIVSLVLAPGKTNNFELRVYDRFGNQIECDPESFSIIQGLKVASPTLPYDICIHAFELDNEKQHLIPIKGLEKNTSLPGKGTEIFRTQEDIRPGNITDKIIIPVYGGEPRSRKSLNPYAGTVEITGESLPGFLPKGSEVEVTLRMDASRRITVQASFPYLDDELYEETLQKFTQETPAFDALSDELTHLISSVKSIVDEGSNIDDISLTKISSEAATLKIQLESGKEDNSTRLEILNRLRELLKEFDSIKQAAEWPAIQQELIDQVEHLEATIEQYGDDKAEAILIQIQQQAKAILDKKNTKMAKEIISQIQSIDFAVVEEGAGPALWISFLKGFDEDFDQHDWEDAAEARGLINEAKEIIVANRASTATLRPIVSRLFSLLPSADQPISNRDKNILEK